MRMRHSFYPVYRRELYSGGFPIHAALVERDNKGVLLAASGGIGKSTCCHRIPHPWRVLGEDEALIVTDDRAQQYLAHPLPTWSNHRSRISGNSLNVEQYVPLSAVFFLKRGELDEVIPLGQGKGAAYLQSLARQKCTVGWKHLEEGEQICLRRSLFHNSCDLARAIPTFILRLTSSGRFWEKIEETLDLDVHKGDHLAQYSVSSI